MSQLVHDVFHEARKPLDGEAAVRLASERPRDVVAAARVAELHARLQRSKLERDAVQDATQRGEDGADALDRLRAQPAGRPARADAVKRLHEGARRRAATEFARTQMALADEGHSALAATLGASTRLLADLRTAARRVAPLCPPAWSVVRVYRSAIEGHLRSQLAPLWSGPRGDELEVEELTRAYVLRRGNTSLPKR